MDVGGGKAYPANALSNFAPHPFELDGVKIASMEGWLQSLKFKGVDMQEHVCTLVGKAAKFKGKKKPWYRTQTLHWRGVDYKRGSSQYQNLLNRAYQAMFDQNEGFRNALKAAGKDANFTHSIGKNDSSRTILTTAEFCGRLMRLKRIIFEDGDKLKTENEEPSAEVQLLCISDPEREEQ